MLIYNHKKEFLGIDESDLRALGIANMREFENEASDIADLFVKNPGYIHNFKHVHWIDYVTCNEAGSEAKVIINAKGKNYSATVDIKTFYLIGAPAEKGYAVNLLNIRPLSGVQSERIPTEQAEAPAAKKIVPEAEAALPQPKEEPALYKTTYDPYETDDDISAINDIQETPKTPEISPLDIMQDEEFDTQPPIEESRPEPVQSRLPVMEEEESFEHDEENPFADYIYNPKTASEDLGLPIDLVEEFVQDFIAQAESFKRDLYDSAASGNMDNLKIQSHKLKGVAANLRIEDALDALTKVNTLDDPQQIRINLDRLYRIINKLANKEFTLEEDQLPEKAKPAQPEEDDFILSFKEEKLHDFQPQNIDDSQVPDSIEMPELADDEFLKSDFNADEQINKVEDLSILDNEGDLSNEEAQETETAQEQHAAEEFTYDKHAIAHEMGLNIESFNELFDDYLHETKDLAGSIASALQKNELDTCRGAAIKIKGMSENMRIHKFDDEIAAIMASQNAEEMNPHVQKIFSIIEQISVQRG